MDVGSAAGLAAYLSDCQVGAATPNGAQLLVACVAQWQGQVMVQIAPGPSVRLVGTVARFPQFLNVRRIHVAVVSSEEIVALLVWFVKDAYGGMRGDPVRIAAPPWRQSAERLVTVVALLCGGCVDMRSDRPHQWRVCMQSGRTWNIVFNVNCVCVSSNCGTHTTTFDLPALTTMHPRHSVLVSGSHCEASIVRWLCTKLTQKKN